MSDVKKKVREFADIAQSLPESLQVVCFELLLKNHLGLLDARSRTSVGKDAEKSGGEAEGKQEETRSPEEMAQKQADLTLADLHLKVRKLLEKYSLSIDHLNNLFYKEHDQVLPLYEDLRTTRMSEGQIRIALLQALRRAIENGQFEAIVEEVRAEASDRKCYDGANFAANFKNNKALFDFDKYTKSTQSVRLSESGKGELAAIIKELQ